MINCFSFNLLSSTLGLEDDNFPFGPEEDPNNKNVVNCDEKSRSILLGKPQVELAELPTLIKLHFPKEAK
ncbi:hypothetical protein ACSBR1_015667 [Camellia fascicularis]